MTAFSQRIIDLMKTSKNDVLELELSEIKAGQPAIGQDQVLYKVGRYDGVNWILEDGYPVQGRTFSDDEKMFDDVAYANGQKVDNAVIVRFDDSTPGNPDSYYVYNENWERVAPGTVTNGMKTVVIGPDKNPYLTDGHHTLNTFSQMKRGGFEDFKINLVVEANYSNLKDKNNNGSSMDEFWIEMANSGNAWLKVLNENEPGYRYLNGVKGEQDEYMVHSVDLDRFKGQLPEEMKPEAFRNDPYRAIMNFTRGIAWEAPEGTKADGLPFLEFYWAEEIQNAIGDGNIALDVHTEASPYNLSDLDSYVSAVQEISNWIINLEPDTIIGTSGFTAREMGQKPEIDAGKLNSLIDSGKTLEASSSDEKDAVDVPSFGKLGYAWAQRNGGSEGNDRLTGLPGPDLFVLSPGNDVISDFRIGEDSISVAGTPDLRFRQTGEGLLIRAGDDICTLLLNVHRDAFLAHEPAHLHIIPAQDDNLI